MKIIKNLLFITAFAVTTMSFTLAFEKVQPSWDYCDGYADAAADFLGLDDYAEAIVFENCMGW